MEKSQYIYIEYINIYVQKIFCKDIKEVAHDPAYDHNVDHVAKCQKMSSCQKDVKLMDYGGGSQKNNKLTYDGDQKPSKCA